MTAANPYLVDDPEYVRLLDRLSARYDLTTEVVRFDAEEFHFTKVSNPGDLPVDLDKQGNLRWQPYWAEDWASSRAICRLLLERNVRERTVLDLGCGLGLTGAVAARSGATVCFVDNAEPALDFSRLNCWPWRDHCTFLALDWHADNRSLLGQFDTIIGGEIIYDSDDWSTLNLFWKRHLTDSGSVLLCDPFRKTGREFRDWITDHAWQTDFREMTIPEINGPVNVIELRKQSR